MSPPQAHGEASSREGQVIAACLPLNEWPASASKAAEFINHPAAPFALVRITFAPNPTSVTRLPRSPARYERTNE